MLAGGIVTLAFTAEPDVGTCRMGEAGHIMGEWRMADGHAPSLGVRRIIQDYNAPLD